MNKEVSASDLVIHYINSLLKSNNSQTIILDFSIIEQKKISFGKIMKTLCSLNLWIGNIHTF